MLLPLPCLSCWQLQHLAALVVHGPRLPCLPTLRSWHGTCPELCTSPQPRPRRSASPNTVEVAAPTVTFQISITGFNSDTFGAAQQAAYTKQIESSITCEA